MQIHTQEHQDIMAMFEKQYKGFARMDKEAKELWSNGRIYQHGELNELFKAYRSGYSHGRCVYLQQG